MKKILFAGILPALILACSSPKHDGYIIKGTIIGINEGQAIITNNPTTESISDTAEIKKGKFTFTGKLTTPENYVLIIGDKHVWFFLDNSEITIRGDLVSLDQATVSGGSPLNKGVQAIKDKQNAVRNAYQPDNLIMEYNDASPERKKEIEELIDAINKELEAIDATYIKENPASPYTAILVQSKMDDYLNKVDELVALVETMDAAPALANNRYVQELKMDVAALKRLEIGQQAPDFTQSDPNENPITFSDIYKKNKLTMIDFWAGWCPPCRQFNPTLVKLYNKYHQKGFEIIGVSMDRTKEQWTKAIADDKLTWPQVSTITYWDNPVGKLYYIRYIPQNVFVDTDGKIVAKRVPEEETDIFLEEYLK